MPFAEKLAYTVKEVSELMALSRNSVIALFETEPGTLILRRPETMHKRSYRNIRIPHHVYARVIKRLSV